MTKTPIAIISVLKPVDDTRAFEKMAMTLAKTNDYNITIVGQATRALEGLPTSQKIRFAPLPGFKRLGLKRVFIPILIFRKLLQLKPKLIIVNTYELLMITILNQILFGTKTIYDIQENYHHNLLYQDNYPWSIKFVFSKLIRFKEWCLSPLIHHFILAEKGYEHELGFIKNRFTIIENKAIVRGQIKDRKVRNAKMKFLFAGNISENSGVLNAVALYQSVRKPLPDSELTIIGHCPSPSLLNRLLGMANDRIHVKLSLTPIPHDEIVDQIICSDFGIVAYTLNKSNKNCMPTKVFEYLAYGLPIICQTGTLWSEYAQRFGAAIEVDFQQFDLTSFMEKLTDFQRNFQPKQIEEVMWASEEPKLIHLVKSLTES